MAAQYAAPVCLFFLVWYASADSVMCPCGTGAWDPRFVKATCQACRNDQTIEAYCLTVPNHPDCVPPTMKPTPDPTSKPTSGRCQRKCSNGIMGIGSARCQACVNNLTLKEFCRILPSVSGCPGADDPEKPVPTMIPTPAPTCPCDPGEFGSMHCQACRNNLTVDEYCLVFHWNVDCLDRLLFSDMETPLSVETCDSHQDLMNCLLANCHWSILSASCLDACNTHEQELGCLLADCRWDGDGEICTEHLDAEG